MFYKKREKTSPFHTVHGQNNFFTNSIILSNYFSPLLLIKYWWKMKDLRRKFAVIKKWATGIDC